MMLARTPEFTKIPLRSFAIGCMGGLRCFKGPKPNLSAVQSYFRIEFSSASLFGNPLQAKWIGGVNSSIVLVLLIAGWPKIFNAVTGSVFVSVIHLLRRIGSIQEFPDNAMSLEGLSLDPKDRVSITGSPNKSSRKALIPGHLPLQSSKMVYLPLSPPQRAGFRIVVKALAQIRDWWQLAWSHEILPKGTVVRAVAGGLNIGVRPHPIAPLIYRNTRVAV